MTVAAPPAIAGLSQIIDRYDGLLLDLWGCIHDGLRPYPGVVDTLKNLRAAGKRLLVLSNAPRRAPVVAAGMERIGIDPSLCDAILSSGEATWLALAQRDDPWHARLGRRCLHIGPERDAGLYEGNGLTVATGVGDADFVLATGPIADEYDLAAHEEILAACRARDLPMVCANPDLEVMRGDLRLICSGALAQRYEEMGGDVRQHGKPYPAVYARALQLLGVADRRRVLGVGDSLRTDVTGASGAGLDSVLITGGIHGEELGVVMGEAADPARVAPWLARFPVHPTYVASALRW